MRATAFAIAAAVLALTGSRGALSASQTFTGAIVFERDPGAGSDIYVATTPKTARPLVATPAQEFDPALSAEGRVAFARALGERSEIFVYDSGRVRQTTKDGAVDQHPAWSPDGNRIACSSDKGKGADIMEVQVGEPASARPIAPAAGDDFTPSYSRDGRIAFASNRSGNFELYIVTPRGKLTRLTRDGDVELSPAWSPDGRRIAFTRLDRRGNADIWLIDLATRRATKLTSNPADDSDPAFSPDGRQIAFVSDRGALPGIWTMPAKKGARAKPFNGGKPSVDLGPQWGSKAPSIGRTFLAPLAATAVTCPTTGPLAGTAGADTITGSDTADDTICGLGGNDTIRGLGGHDTLLGGANSDSVIGGNAGDPIISGGTQKDKLAGGYGDDKLFARDAIGDSVGGGPGFDRCRCDSVDVKTSVEGTIA
jgi:Tol biopolymer transport system component